MTDNKHQGLVISLLFILTTSIINKEQKEYVTKCIFKITKEDDDWEKEEKSLKVIEMIQLAKEEKGNIFYE